MTKPEEPQLSLYLSGEFSRVVLAKPELAQLVRALGRYGKVVIFGGFVRDAIHNFIHADRQEFRDLDLVVSGKLERPEGQAKNHFGGYRSWVAGGMKIDYWPLKTTYAFSRGFFQASLATLPLTTVYTINACAFDPNEAKLFDHSAVEAISARKISFNCRECLTIFPQYQAFRAVDFSERLSYELDADVEGFVCDVMSSTPLETFVQAVKEHRPEVDRSRLVEMYESRRQDARAGTQRRRAI